MENKQMEAMVNARVEVLKREAEERERQLIRLAGLEDEINVIRESLGLLINDRSTLVRQFSGDGPDTERIRQAQAEGLDKHKARVAGMIRTSGEILVRRERYVDLDMGGGFPTFETLAVKSIGTYNYVMRSSRSEKNPVGRHNTQQERTEIYLFNDVVEQPLSVEFARYSEVPIDFPMRLARIESWGPVICSIDEAYAASDNPHDRWDKVEVSRGTPTVTLV